MARSRAFCFTINNDTPNDLDSLLDISFRYLVFGFEEGSKTKTPHIQGYIYMDNAKTIKSMSKKMPRASIRICKGTPQENFDYCTKESECYEFGDIPTQGRATMDKIEDAMKNPFDNIVLYNQYRKVYRELTISKKKDHDRKLFLIPTEMKYATANNYESVSFDHSFETYNGEQVVFIPSYTQTEHIYDWCHGYPHTIKRGYELIVCDPEIIYLMYDTPKEKGYMIKKYLPYIVDVQ